MGLEEPLGVIDGRAVGLKDALGIGEGRVEGTVDKLCMMTGLKWDAQKNLGFCLEMRKDERKD